MSSRLEYKFLVPDSHLDTLRRHLSVFVDIDPFAGERECGEYTVRSVYCDTMRSNCYHEKMDGIRVRKKYRIRGYNRRDDDCLLFLEIKRKKVNAIDKNRAPFKWSCLHRIFSSDDIGRHIISLSNNGKETKDAQRFLYHYYAQRLSPAILIVYEREAFYGKFDRSLRITFDKNVRSKPVDAFDHLFDETDLRPARSGYFILEVKFWGSLPSWLRSIIRQYGLSRLALSKYTICLNSHKNGSTSSRPINIRSIGLDVNPLSTSEK